MSINFSNNIASFYDHDLGPVIFDPYASDFSSRFEEVATYMKQQRNGPINVLELACGTGRLTKQLLPLLGDGDKLVATDISEGMLNVGKTVLQTVESKGASLICQTEDMLSLSFQDGSFDIVIAQFGCMLCGDPLKAFEESRRVLTVGGKFMFSVWAPTDRCKVFQIAAQVPLELSLFNETLKADPDTPTKIQSISDKASCLGDAAAVQSQLTSKGYGDISVSSVEVTITDTDNLAHGLAYGSPFAMMIADDKRDDYRAGLKSKYGEQITLEALVYVATAV